nr:hypothetical protein [uncultured Desulfosarcina sp.]
MEMAAPLPVIFRASRPINHRLNEFEKYYQFSGNEKRRDHHTDITAPTVIIHSVEDDYIPFSQAARLFDSALGPKFMLKTDGSHLDLFDSQTTALSRLMGYLSV